MFGILAFLTVTALCLGIQGDQEPSEPKSIEDIADEEFEEIVGDEGDEDGEPGSSEEDDEGEQGEGSDDDSEGKGGESDPPKRKWAGQYDTPEEMEAAYIKSLQKPSDDQDHGKRDEGAGALPDLSEAELNTMSEQDEQDGTAFLEEYLRRKMQERNLEKHEVSTLRKIDSEKGTDLVGDYHELRTVRAVQRQTAPLIRKSQEEQQKIFENRERQIDQSNTKEFGGSLKDLEKYVSDPKNVEKVLQSSPIAHLIISEHERGSPATAHKLLLREANAFKSNQDEGKADDKRRRSVRADAGSNSSRAPKQTDSAATIEEAFDLAEAELDQE